MLTKRADTRRFLEAANDKTIYHRIATDGASSAFVTVTGIMLTPFDKFSTRPFSGMTLGGGATESGNGVINCHHRDVESAELSPIYGYRLYSSILRFAGLVATDFMREGR